MPPWLQTAILTLFWSCGHLLSTDLPNKNYLLGYKLLFQRYLDLADICYHHSHSEVRPQVCIVLANQCWPWDCKWSLIGCFHLFHCKILQPKATKTKNTMRNWNKEVFHIFNLFSTPISVRTMVVLTASSLENFCPHC